MVSWLVHFSFITFPLLLLILIGTQAHAAHLEQDGLYIDSGVLVRPQVIKPSPDGKHLYVGNARGDSITAFSIESSSGDLVYIANYTDDIDSIDGLMGVTSLAFTPDGLYLYATGHDDGAVSVFSRNPTNGQLTFITSYTADDFHKDYYFILINAADITISNDGNFVYVADWIGISVFSRNTTTGLLTFIEHLGRAPIIGYSHLSFPIDVSLSPDGKHLYLLSNGGDAVFVFERDPVLGKLIPVTYYVQTTASTDPYRLDGVIDAVFSPDGNYLYIASNVSDAIALFSRDSNTGELVLIRNYEIDEGGLDGIRSLSISPDGEYIYAASQDANQLNVYARNELDGTLALISSYIDEIGGIDGLQGVWGQAVTPDGAYVYCAAGAEYKIGIFNRDIANGSLTFSAVKTRYDYAQELHIYAPDTLLSPDGNYLYIASLTDNAITVYAVDPTGNLNFIETQINGKNGVMGLEGVKLLAISNDGKTLYSLSNWQNAVSVFQRDQVTGRLTFVESYQDDQYEPHPNGLDGLYGAWRFRISPDDRHLYVVSLGDSAISVFERDVTTGQLTYVETLKGTATGPIPLAMPLDVAVSFDGNDVYVTDEYTEFIYQYKRDSSTGRLIYRNSWDALGSPIRLQISPDDGYIYTANYGLGEYLNIFVRDSVNGELTEYEQFYRPRFESHYEGSQNFIISEDGAYLYVSYADSGSIVVYERNFSDGRLRFADALRTDASNSTKGLFGAYGLSLNSIGEKLYVAALYDDAITSFKVQVADLVLTAQPPLEPLYAGGVYQFHFDIENQGLTEATRVYFNNQVSTQATINSVTPDQGSCNVTNDVIECNIGNVMAGANIQVIVELAFTQISTITQKATASLAERESDRNNNTLETVSNIQQNNPPIPNIDLVETDEDIPVTTQNVLANDNDPESNILTIIRVDNVSAQGGTIADIGDGSFAYTPTDNYYGSDTFTYTVTDGFGNEAVGTVSITVKEVNDPPFAKDDSVNGIIDQTISAIHLLANDSDIDGDLFLLTTLPAQSTQGGTLQDNGDGTVDYMPPAGFTGADYFEYIISDGRGGTDSAMVSINVATASSSTDSSGGGGCAYNPNAEPDLILPLLILISLIYIGRCYLRTALER